MYKYTHTCAHVYIYVWKPEDNLRHYSAGAFHFVCLEFLFIRFIFIFIYVSV